jgi:oxygen-dependent protoporphyrinogen oxidase
MEEIVAALARQLGSRLRLNDPIDRIEFRAGPPAWVLSRANGERVTADRLVVATGAAAAARLLAPVDAELASLVGGIRTAPLAVLSLGYDRGAADAALEGFGFLVPRGEPARILGAVWDSSVFPDRVPPGHTLIRVIMGGGRDPGVVALDDRELLARARADLLAVCGVKSDPAFVHVVRHVPGLPQYVVGHADRVAAIEARLQLHPGLTLIGNSYQGLAVNACISTARRAAHRLAGPADGRPDPPRL